MGDFVAVKNLEQEDESSSSEDETTDEEVVDAEFDKVGL